MTKYTPLSVPLFKSRTVTQNRCIHFKIFRHSEYLTKYKGIKFGKNYTFFLCRGTIRLSMKTPIIILDAVRIMSCEIYWLDPEIYTSIRFIRSRDSVVGIATRYWLEGPGSNPGGARFSAPIQTGSGAHPVSCTMGTGSFGDKGGLGVMLTTHPLLVPRLRKS